MSSRHFAPTSITHQTAATLAHHARPMACLCIFAWLALACGGSDAPPTAKARERDAGMQDGGASTEMDASQNTPKPTDAGKKMTDSGSPRRDADKDSAVSVVVDAGPGDIYAKPGPAPDTWLCAKALWADGHCDCGCGATDADCAGQSCTAPGCIAPTCDACFTTERAWKSCEPEPDPSAWTCGMVAQTDTFCDCGCGAPDAACGGSGCSEPGCWRGACDFRHDAAGAMLTDSRPPLSWRCPTAAWGGGNGCDCGCGSLDPDCYGAHACTNALCNDTECTICHDNSGRSVPCDATLRDWQCEPQRFGSGDGCDCGCGVADPDCTSGGCTSLGCREAACSRCTDESYQLGGCVSRDTWTCDLSHYGTGDGCDCGCGVRDPDCSANSGCTAAGCQQAACDYCHTGTAADTHVDSFDDYQICSPGWTCGSAEDPAWANAECDCGCGKPDPYCRTVDRLSCTAPGCTLATCQYCNTDGSRASCEGPKWSTTGTCAPENFGLDGKCDCGCGAVDPDCAPNTGCSEAVCAANGCEVCHGSGSLLANCYNWNCAAEAFGDGKCDCGCGAPDPDCAGLGCSEPGCRGDSNGDMDVCKPNGCHDPYGRSVPCP